MIAVMGFVLSANANTGFEVTNVTTSHHQDARGAFTITVTVRPTFTPTGNGSYTVIVVPTNSAIANLLGSQRQEITFGFENGRWRSGPSGTSARSVTFMCYTDRRPHCTVNDFAVSRSFRNH